MTDLEIKQLVKIVADEAADRAIDKAKQEWAKDIQLHAVNCQAQKYGAVKNLLSAMGGGVVVAAVNWILGKS